MKLIATKINCIFKNLIILKKDFELFQTGRYFMKEAVFPKATICKAKDTIKKITNVHLILFTDILLVGTNTSKTNNPNQTGKFKYKTHFFLAIIKISDNNEKLYEEPYVTLEDEKNRSITIFFSNPSTKLLWVREISELNSLLVTNVWKSTNKNFVEELKDEIEKHKFTIEHFTLLDAKNKDTIQNLEISLLSVNNDLLVISFFYNFFYNFF